MPKRYVSVIALAAALAIACGCERRTEEHAYQVFTGAVKAVDAEAGELYVRVDEVQESWHTSRTVFCVATKDSEIYINDRFAGLEEIRPGDSVEVIGYREGDRFVVTQASVTRAEPPPSEPKLPAASQTSAISTPSRPTEP